MLAVLIATTILNPLTIPIIGGKPIPLTGHKALTIVFLTNDCPIANDSQPDLERIHKQFNSTQTLLVGVYINPKLTESEAKKHKADFQFSYLQSIDRTHALVKHLKATTTPEAFVIDNMGKVQYRGRINNMYSDLGVRRKSVTENDLADAIRAISQGQNPKTKQTKPYGCLIPDLADFDDLE